jgi:hypothetical protein
LWTAIAETPFGEYEEPEMPDMEWKGKYKIVCKNGSLVKRTGPGKDYPATGSDVDDYTYDGEEYIAYEKKDQYYRISEDEQIWISGKTQWTEIMKYLEPVPVEPVDPEPEPETWQESVERRLKALEDKVL